MESEMRAILATSLLFLHGCGSDKTPKPISPSAASKCVPTASRLCPIDEAAADSSLVEFRRELVAVVDRRDAEGLLRRIDPGIRTSFGEDGGVKAFQEIWQPQSTSSSLWDELHQVLTNGGTFREIDGERWFWAPYIFSAWPDSIDAFQFAAAMRANVPLRSSPSDSGAVTATLDWAIVELIPDSPPDPDSKWIHVRTMEGNEGWVSESDVRSPIDYRAGFQEMNGEWRMSVLVAGD
jgi:hypothetical protein